MVEELSPFSKPHAVVAMYTAELSVHIEYDFVFGVQGSSDMRDAFLVTLSIVVEHLVASSCLTRDLALGVVPVPGPGMSIVRPWSLWWRFFSALSPLTLMRVLLYGMIGCILDRRFRWRRMEAHVGRGHGQCWTLRRRLMAEVDLKLAEDSVGASEILADALMKERIEQGRTAPFMQ